MGRKKDSGRYSTDLGVIRSLLLKMKGGAPSPPAVGLSEVIWAWIGSVIGIGVCGCLSALYFEPREMTLLIGSFGASAVLLRSRGTLSAYRCRAFLFYGARAEPRLNSGYLHGA